MRHSSIVHLLAVLLVFFSQPSTSSKGMRKKQKRAAPAGDRVSKSRRRGKKSCSTSMPTSTMPSTTIAPTVTNEPQITLCNSGRVGCVTVVQGCKEFARFQLGPPGSGGVFDTDGCLAACAEALTVTDYFVEFGIGGCQCFEGCATFTNYTNVISINPILIAVGDGAGADCDYLAAAENERCENTSFTSCPNTNGFECNGNLAAFDSGGSVFTAQDCADFCFTTAGPPFQRPYFSFQPNPTMPGLPGTCSCYTTCDTAQTAAGSAIFLIDGLGGVCPTV